MKRSVISCLALCLFAGMVDISGMAGISSVKSVQAQDVKVTIPERTEIRLVLTQSLKSGAAKEDSEVPFEVKSDIVEPGTGVILIKAGTPAFGKVIVSKRRGMFGKPGKLDFSCDYVLMPDLSRVPLRSKVESVYGRDNRGASVATAVLLAPIAIFVHGRDVSANKGQEYSFYVDKTTIAGTKPVQPVALAATVQAAPLAPVTPVAPVVPVTPVAGNTDANAPSSARQWVFVTQDGAIIGTFLGFDGTGFNVGTSDGLKSLKLADVKSVVAAKSATPSTEKSVIIMKNGSFLMGMCVRFEGNAFVVASEDGQKSIKANDVKSISMIKS